jgi:exopolyphosphatase/guanosine-5'-triphosphate,3'-diphosphate pyrophosphatase
MLLPDAIERGLSALFAYKEKATEYNVSKTRLIATSAIRGASNRDYFISQVREMLDWEIEVIDGDKEAEYIFNGVVESLPLIHEKYLMLDIGGGSNEFILASGKTIIWKKSFNIGIARVLENFRISDPPEKQEIELIEIWFEQELKELTEICLLHKPQILVGCSGAFDTLMDIFEGEDPDVKQRISSDFPLSEYHKIHSELISVNKFNRCLIKGVDHNRVEMIVIATLFINFILRKLHIKRLIHSHFSLREGVMFEMIRQ